MIDSRLTVEAVLRETASFFTKEGIPPARPWSYFGMAIKGDRRNLENARTIASIAGNYTAITSKHVLLDDVKEFEVEWKKMHPEINVYDRDVSLIRKSDYFIADVTGESVGVDIETAKARRYGKHVTLFCNETTSKPTLVSHSGGKGALKSLFTTGYYDAPVFYYNSRNLREVAERELRNLFVYRHPYKEPERFEIRKLLDYT